MKSLITVLTLVAFVAMATMSFAAEPAKPAGKEGPADPSKTVNCCVNKECKKVGSDAECTKMGGKVVKDCKDCK